jgi:urea transport system substrate-binding protein
MMTSSFGRREFLMASSATLASSLLLKACRTQLETDDKIKVGILHSQTGALATSEQSVINAELLAIEEINKAGGLLGQEIEPIIEDCASEDIQFAEKARKLIEQDQVVAIFGCWTSASRKAVLPMFEHKNHMLWYPMHYEGQECSQNIFYTGAVPNQQIEPSVDWLLDTFEGKPFYIVGSDDVFSRTANTIIKAQLAAKNGKVAGEDNIPMGNSDVTALLSKIKGELPDGGVIYNNSLPRDSNVIFFKELQAAAMGPDKYPCMSVGISEDDVKVIGIDALKGHYAAWNYLMTVEGPANQKFVDAFKAKYGADQVTNTPVEAAYIAVYLWKQAVEKAKTATDIKAVRKAALGQTFDAPEGMVTMENNHHLSRFVRIGQVRADGQFDIVFTTPDPVKPVPWNQFVSSSKGFSCDWSDPAKKGGKFKMT